MVEKSFQKKLYRPQKVPLSILFQGQVDLQLNTEFHVVMRVRIIVTRCHAGAIGVGGVRIFFAVDISDIILDADGGIDIVFISQADTGLMLIVFLLVFDRTSEANHPAIRLLRRKGCFHRDVC